MTRKNDKSIVRRRHEEEIERWKKAEAAREAKRTARLEKWQRHLEYRAKLAEERANQMAVAPPPREEPTIQDIPRAPKIQVDALMETDSGFASSMGRTGQRIVSISYGDAKPKGVMASGITKKRRLKSKKEQIIVKSLHTIKHNLEKKQVSPRDPGAEDGMDMS